MENLDRHVQNTHLSVSEDLVGKVERIESGKFAQVSLTVDSRMRVDEKGLVHGGFAFGLADYAAMVAVNDPFVVLLSAQVRFVKPVKAGETLTARAQVQESEGKKRRVRCEVFNPVREKVLEGEFLCLVLSQHVLEKRN
ncbi:MAG: PaaI family thioesterase [Planctomycetaceae bacterium]